LSFEEKYWYAPQREIVLLLRTMSGTFIDLSHSLSDATPVFSGDDPVRVAVVEQAGGLHPSGRRSLNCSRLETSVHTGTHMDAPFHFFNDGPTIGEIPLAACVGEAVLVDLRPLPPRTELRKQHVEPFAAMIRAAKRVILSTGWAAEWTRPAYFRPYPVLSGELADFLVSLGVLLVGVDTPSVDDPPFPAHLSLLGHGVLIVENLTNLEQIQADRFHLTVAPLKILGRDGSPVRAVAQHLSS
jgi:arylformamidase